MTTDRHRQLTQGGGYFAQTAPAGAHLWLTRLNQPDIFRLDLCNGAERELWQSLSLADWENWQVCKSGIYYLDRASSSLMFVPPESEPRTVIRGSRTFPYLGPAFHVSADECTIVFDQITQSDDAILIASVR